jgi:hypothetical protein
MCKSKLTSIGIYIDPFIHEETETQSLDLKPIRTAIVKNYDKTKEEYFIREREGEKA